MYYTHNLRVKLQEWLNRLYRSSGAEFDNNMIFFRSNLGGHALLRAMLEEAAQQSEGVDPLVAELHRRLPQQTWYLSNVRFKNEAHRAAFSYRLLQSVEAGDGAFDALAMFIGGLGGRFEQYRDGYLDNYIRPIITYLHDRLDESSSVLYLLEKYKFRVENFTKAALAARYNAATASYEQVLEDDLRLYLFDQGIDYPFSTPKSASGRADIVGQLDTADPLVLEIKIFDSERSYRKDRIISGFKQAVRYAEDYNKTVAYIAVFVLDDVQIDITGRAAEREWPVRVEWNGRHYYFVFISLYTATTASSRKPLQAVSVSREELVGEMQ